MNVIRGNNPQELEAGVDDEQQPHPGTDHLGQRIVDLGGGKHRDRRGKVKIGQQIERRILKVKEDIARIGLHQEADIRLRLG